MRTTGLYFGERFKLEFRPMNKSTPDLGKMDRDVEGHHLFDSFQKAVVDHLRAKGIPAAAFIGDRFEVLVDGKKDQTATRQQHLYQECKEVAEQAIPPEDYVKGVQHLLDMRLRKLLKNQELSNGVPQETLREAYAEDIECLQAWSQKNQVPIQESAFSKQDADELAVLREIEQLVKEQGPLVLLTESVHAKIPKNRWLPVRSREDDVQWLTRVRMEALAKMQDDWCELEAEPLVLDYQLRQGTKPGKAHVEADQFVFPYLPNLVQAVKRYLPASSGNAQQTPWKPTVKPGKQQKPGQSATGNNRAPIIDFEKQRNLAGKTDGATPVEGSAAVFDFAKEKRKRFGR
ncbi:MAG TPA: hypothetical protein V6C52_15065 [Coleofasciculaceae cyanobacterium]|jgi:hypothetical protein